MKLFLFLFLLMIPVQALSAATNHFTTQQDPAETLKITIDDLQLQAGENFRLAVWVENVNSFSVTSFAIKLSYPQHLITIRNVHVNNTVSSGGIIVFNPNIRDTLRVSYANSTHISENGVLMYIEGHANAQSGEGAFKAEEVALRNNAGATVPTTIINGKVRVGTPTNMDEDQPDLPHKTQLHEAYPNPFNPSTVIPFTLRESGHVKMTAIDSTGREIGIITEQHYNAGRHEIRYDASHLPSGMYLVNMEAHGERHSIKIALVR